MNEIMKCLHERKSVRVFENRMISEEDKLQILYAAMEAPIQWPTPFHERV